MGQNIVLYKYPLADISPRTEVPFFYQKRTYKFPILNQDGDTVQSHNLNRWPY